MKLLNTLSLASLATVAAALPKPSDAMSHFHLTPGAWHGPWAFDLIRAELEARGYTTSASTLPSVGTTNPSQALNADVAAVRADVERLVDAGKEVVLVGHSYGGAVMGSAVEGLGAHQRKAAGHEGGIVSQIWMTAFALDVGGSLGAGVGAVLPEWWGLSADKQFFSPLTPENIFYNDVTDKALVAKSVAALRSEPFKITSETATYAPWKEGFKVGYIFCELDNAIGIAAQKGMASQFPAGSFTATMNASHSPFLSQPKELADHLVAALKHAKCQ
ncbi:hypothetical protein RB595_006972 [Gaeumannomyces hyphopodioides]